MGELQRRRRLLAAASSSFEIAAEARPLLAAASRYLSSRMKVMSIGLEDLADGALRPAQRARVPNSGGRGRGARRCRRGSFGTCFRLERGFPELTQFYPSSARVELAHVINIDIRLNSIQGQLTQGLS